MINRRNWRKRAEVGLAAVLSLLLVLLCLPESALASESGWDAALVSVEQLHDAWTSVESLNKEDKQQIQQLRKQNNDELKRINAAVQRIDKTKLDPLKLQADQVQKKYAPLLAEYAELGKKAAEARKRKDSKSALLYDLKRNRMKTSVNHARQEIKQKKEAYSSARKQAAVKAKAVKDMLAGIQPIKKQITAENSKITGWNQSKSAADKRYKSAVKQGDAISAAVELKSMVNASNQIRSSLGRIMDWEKAIREKLRIAQGKLPASA
ncbi:hypothetical protein ACTHPF_03365 [Paenibacillus sp. SAF-054]|uniref:hypothetical protein n=1 Tax=unclassified Paenibacillus TaxID=185978 RepID=UPI003F801A1D